MSDLTIYQPPAPAADYQTRAVARLAEWAHSADAAYHVAERLVQSSFVPAAFRGKPVDATAAILAGSEVGLSPMSSLRAFDVIQGQAAPRAITLRAIAQSFGHEIEVVESTATRCKVQARRRGAERWQSVAWTIDRARDLGLLGKDQWKKQPQAMLVARATAEAARLVAADAILGIGYTAEEVADGGAEPVEVVDVEPPTPTGTRRMSRPRPAPTPEPEEPALEPEPDHPGAHVEPEAMITQAQQRALHATLRDLGAEDRETGLAMISGVLGVDVESTRDLTREQASRVIDGLKRIEAPDALDV